MIIIEVRPKSLYLPPAEWTTVTIEGDCEAALANLLTAHLLSTRHEVQDDVEEGVDPLAPWESSDDEN
jgi:hypothetical protein